MAPFFGRELRVLFSWCGGQEEKQLNFHEAGEEEEHEVRKIPFRQCAISREFWRGSHFRFLLHFLVHETNDWRDCITTYVRHLALKVGLLSRALLSILSNTFTDYSYFEKKDCFFNRILQVLLPAGGKPILQLNCLCKLASPKFQSPTGRIRAKTRQE